MREEPQPARTTTSHHLSPQLRHRHFAPHLPRRFHSQPFDSRLARLVRSCCAATGAASASFEIGQRRAVYSELASAEAPQPPGSATYSPLRAAFNVCWYAIAPRTPPTTGPRLYTHHALVAAVPHPVTRVTNPGESHARTPNMEVIGKCIAWVAWVARPRGGLREHNTHG